MDPCQEVWIREQAEERMRNGTLRSRVIDPSTPPGGDNLSAAVVMTIMAIAGVAAGIAALIYIQNILVSASVALLGATIGGIVGRVAGSAIQSALAAFFSSYKQ